MKKRIKATNPMAVQKGEAVFCYIVMAIICIIALFPIVWVVISSFKADLLAEPGFSLPKEICLDGYIRVFTKLGIGKYFVNSAICATVGTFLSDTMNYIVGNEEMPKIEYQDVLNIMNTEEISGVIEDKPSEEEIKQMVNELNDYIKENLRGEFNYE